MFLNKHLKLLLIIIFFLGKFYYFSSPVYSTIYFEDNFENIEISKNKWVVEGPQIYNGDGTKANWQFKDGRYGIIIDGLGSQYNESVPSDNYWDNNWVNYIYEVDFILGEGPHPEIRKPSDTNLVFRFQGHNRWYGIHGINDENLLVLQKKGENWNQTPPQKTFSYNYNTPYRIKVRVENENIKVTIINKVTNEEFNLWNIIDSGTTILSG
ncbi:MAG: hypothetical protein QW134_09365, partial [Nitrososphaeria archaeon]